MHEMFKNCDTDVYASLLCSAYIADSRRLICFRRNNNKQLYMVRNLIELPVEVMQAQVPCFREHSKMIFLIKSLYGQLER